jgi:guanylate kinase
VLPRAGRQFFGYFFAAKKVAYKEYICYKLLMSKHIICGFLGASGSGKSTIMIQLLNFFPHVSIIKSTSTRPRRDETDDLFYKLVDLGYLESQANKANFLNHEQYAGNHYVYERQELDSVLAGRCGMFAIIESAVPKIRAHGYDLKLIKIIPDREWVLDRADQRSLADAEREKTSDLSFDLVVQNSFKPGGLEASVTQISRFIQQLIRNHTNVKM